VTPYVRVFYYCLIDLYQFTPFRELYAQKVSFGGNQTMRTFVTLVFLAFTLFAIPVQGDKYLTEAQKELLLEQSRTLGLDKEKEHAQNASEQSDQTNFVKQQSRPVKSRPTAPKSFGVINNHSTPHTPSVVNNTRTQTQSLQPKFRNTGRSYPTYGNRPVKQSRQVAKTAPNYQSIKRSRQVSKTARKKTNWSGFFKNLSRVASAINSGLNQTNTQFKPYIQQPNNQSYNPQRTNQIINTMSVGNQTINVGGNHELRTWDVGNQTFGTFDSKEVKMYNFGDFSHGTIGGQKVRCHKAGELKFCN
jgi:hypothetical protein